MKRRFDKNRDMYIDTVFSQRQRTMEGVVCRRLLDSAADHMSDRKTSFIAIFKEKIFCI